MSRKRKSTESANHEDIATFISYLTRHQAKKQGVEQSIIQTYNDAMHAVSKRKRIDIMQKAKAKELTQLLTKYVNAAAADLTPRDFNYTNYFDQIGQVKLIDSSTGMVLISRTTSPAYRHIPANLLSNIIANPKKEEQVLKKMAWSWIHEFKSDTVAAPTMETKEKKDDAWLVHYWD